MGPTMPLHGPNLDPMVAEVGGLQSPGVKGEAVV